MVPPTKDPIMKAKPTDIPNLPALLARDSVKKDEENEPGRSSS